MRPAAKYAHGIKSKAASAKASASASAKAGNYALPSCKMFPHRPWSTVCISLCHQHLASQQAAALTSQLELGNTHHLSYFTTVPQLFSYFEIPFTERQSCSCAMTKLSGLKILQNSASKQLQYHRIVHMALLDTLLHFSPPLKLMKYVSNQRRLHNVEVTLSIHIYLGAPSLAIACASTLQIRYNGHNSGLKDGELDKIQNTSRTNAKFQLDKYKIPTTGSLID